MKTSPKTLIAVVLAATLLGVIAAGPSGAATRRKPKKFTTTGSIAAFGLVTHYDFLLNCPSVPTTQGVDAYVVEVPAGFQLKPSEVTAEATSSVSTQPSLEMSFYSAGCDQGELYVESPTTVPAGTGYIVVQDLIGGAVEFELTLTQ